MSKIRHYVFNVNMTYSECENLYLGHVKHIVMTAESGVRVQVPSINIKPFIDMRGFVGRFRLTIDSSNKIKDLIRIA